MKEFDLLGGYPNPKKPRYVNQNLRTIKNTNEQTAYDRWRELTGQVTLTYQGQKLTLKKYKPSPCKGQNY